MSDLPADQSTQQRIDMLGEAYKRGLLPPERARLYEEGQRRGLFGKPPVQPSGILQPGGALPAPATPAGPQTAPEGLTPPLAAKPRPSLMQAATDRAGNIKGEMRLLQGYDPQVDYDTGTGWTDAVAMHRADNPAEKKAYLAKRYGQENVFTDRGGRFIVRQGDKMMSPEGTGFINSFMGGTAGLYADAPMLVGMTGGAMVGAPGGPLGAIAGATAGSALGKAAIEGSKVLGGEFQKTLPETAQSVGMAGLYGGAGEGAGRLITGLPGQLGSLFRNKIADVTPETRDLALSVERAGGRAPIRSVAPGLTSPAQKQSIATSLGINFLDDPNRAAVHGRLGEILDSAGFNPAQREAALGEILDPTARVSAREAGQPILGDVRQHTAHLEADVDNLARDADRILTQQLSSLSAIPRRAPAGDLGVDVAAGIGQARQDFSRSMQNIYAQVDRAIAPVQKAKPTTFGPNVDARESVLFGAAEPNVGAPVQEFPGVVPTGAIKREARRVLDALPKDAQGNVIFGDPRVLRSLGQLRDLGPKVTLGDAQRIRSTLGEMGEFTDLTPGVAKRQFDDLRTAVNTAIGAAASDPAAAPAVKMLRRADQLYHDGIRKFEDSTINQIVTQAKTGIMPDPGAIADKVLQPKFTARARAIRNMVGPDVWRRVASADWGNVMQAARDPQTGEMSGRKLATLIQQKDRDGLLELTYGPKLAADMRLYSRRLDVRGGKVPPGALTPDNFSQVMGRLETAQLSKDAFLSKNYLSALSKPGAMADDAVNFVLQPGQETRLMEAQRFFGDASPQMTAIRQQGLKELLNSAIVRTDTGAGTAVVGDGIEKALRRWTPRQQEIMFPGGLANDMRQLAKEINFMFPGSGQDTAGSLISGFVKNLPLGARIPFLAYYGGMSWIFSQPKVIRMLATGLQPGPGKTATRETIRMIFREAGIGELPHPDEAPEPGVMTPSKAAMTVMGRNYGLIPRPPGSGAAKPAFRPPGAATEPRDLRPSVGGP